MKPSDLLRTHAVRRPSKQLKSRCWSVCVCKWPLTPSMLITMASGGTAHLRRKQRLRRARHSAVLSEEEKAEEGSHERVRLDHACSLHVDRSRGVHAPRVCDAKQHL